MDTGVMSWEMEKAKTGSGHPENPGPLRTYLTWAGLRQRVLMLIFVTWYSLCHHGESHYRTHIGKT
jgi:hypothetical protein